MRLKATQDDFISLEWYKPKLSNSLSIYEYINDDRT